jgi:hypothetical protein
MTMQEILDGGACDFTGTLKDGSKRWDYLDQSLVKSCRVNAIRNLEDFPTLAGLTAESAKKLFALQKKIIAGLLEQNETKGEHLDFVRVPTYK